MQLITDFTAAGIFNCELYQAFKKADDVRLSEIITKWLDQTKDNPFELADMISDLKDLDIKDERKRTITNLCVEKSRNNTPALLEVIRSKPVLLASERIRDLLFPLVFQSKVKCAPAVREVAELLSKDDFHYMVDVNELQEYFDIASAKFTPMELCSLIDTLLSRRNINNKEITTNLLLKTLRKIDPTKTKDAFDIYCFAETLVRKLPRSDVYLPRIIDIFDTPIMIWGINEARTKDEKAFAEFSRIRFHLCSLFIGHQIGDFSRAFGVLGNTFVPQSFIKDINYPIEIIVAALESKIKFLGDKLQEEEELRKTIEDFLNMFQGKFCLELYTALFFQLALMSTAHPDNSRKSITIQLILTSEFIKFTNKYPGQVSSLISLLFCLDECGSMPTYEVAQRYFKIVEQLKKFLKDLNDFQKIQFIYRRLLISENMYARFYAIELLNSALDKFPEKREMIMKYVGTEIHHVRDLEGDSKVQGVILLKEIMDKVGI